MHGIQQDGAQVIKEGLVVKGVGGLQDDRREQEVEENSVNFIILELFLLMFYSLWCVHGEGTANIRTK